MANDLCNIVKDVMEAYIWTNFTTSPLGAGSNPPTFVVYQDKIVRGETYITLDNANRKPTLTFNGSVIVTPKECIIKHFSRNTTDRDNIYKDILALLQASKYSFDILDVKELAISKTRFEQEIKIGILN